MKDTVHTANKIQSLIKAFIATLQCLKWIPYTCMLFDDWIAGSLKVLKGGQVIKGHETTVGSQIIIIR